MGAYIVCNKKRNSPRLSTRICEEKCPMKDDCEDFSANFHVPVNQKETPLSPQGVSAAQPAQ
ncbi:MAG: hypothetical protein GY849_15470 [Deltaproteobacteria bacterium]|nr:hypothetical protein [Deltaproteobacteria bacterium]